jgi:hypothetical protein
LEGNSLVVVVGAKRVDVHPALGSIGGVIGGSP